MMLALAGLLLSGCVGAPEMTLSTANAEVARSSAPAMRWDFRPEAQEWTAATLRALRGHGAALSGTVPRDIDRFCPAYKGADTAQRNLFWSGLLSALAKYESTWNPRASGGGGLWLGLLQIDPRTARGYGCRAQSAAALFDGAQNLSCGVRIAAAQVSRDAEIVGGPGRWRGLGRDWAPFRKPKAVADMAAWTRAQDYCRG